MSERNTLVIVWRMESTFVIARRSKCRQNVRHQPQPFRSTECPPLSNEPGSRIPPTGVGILQPAISEDTEPEIVFI